MPVPQGPLTKVQIPNRNSLRGGGPGYMGDGRIPRWRDVSDEDGRLMVLIAFSRPRDARLRQSRAWSRGK
jgi:hypothetical protein